MSVNARAPGSTLWRRDYGRLKVAPPRCHPAIAVAILTEPHPVAAPLGGRLGVPPSLPRPNASVPVYGAIALRPPTRRSSTALRGCTTEQRSAFRRSQWGARRDRTAHRRRCNQIGWASGRNARPRTKAVGPRQAGGGLRQLSENKDTLAELEDLLEQKEEHLALLEAKLKAAVR